MTPADEAAEILIRIFNTLAAGMDKRLKDSHKAEIRRACELLSVDGALAPLEDVARPEPAEYIPANAAIPRDWMAQKRERGER